MIGMPDGILDLFPKWEMSFWRGGEMVAYTFSIDGFNWKCRDLSGCQPKITVFSKTAAHEWLTRFGEIHQSKEG